MTNEELDQLVAKMLSTTTLGELRAIRAKAASEHDAANLKKLDDAMDAVGAQLAGVKATRSGEHNVYALLEVRTNFLGAVNTLQGLVYITRKQQSPEFAAQLDAALVDLRVFLDEITRRHGEAETLDVLQDEGGTGGESGEA